MISKMNIEKRRASLVFRFPPKVFPISKKLNIVTALNTEGDSPVIVAKHHNDAIQIPDRTHRSLRFLMGCVINRSISNTIPTCNPETASMCIIPASANCVLIAVSRP